MFADLAAPSSITAGRELQPTFIYEYIGVGCSPCPEGKYSIMYAEL